MKLIYPQEFYLADIYDDEYVINQSTEIQWVKLKYISDIIFKIDGKYMTSSKGNVLVWQK
jgi:hypothetical protein